MVKSAENHGLRLTRLLWLVIALISTRLVAAPGEITMGKTEQTFPLLETKTGTYTNVTVTKKTKDWIFILHSEGVCNIKATDLSREARIALGYEAPPGADQSSAAKPTSSLAQPLAELSHLKLSAFRLSAIKKFAANWRQNEREQTAEMHAYVNANPMALCIMLGISAIVYIFTSICFWLICRKTHTAPGPLIWVPFFQLIPLLRAANMPRVWFFAYFIPIINIIPVILFSIKIVKARGKSPWVAFLLILPPTSVFAFLYLALSQSAPIQIVKNEILALEIA